MCLCTVSSIGAFITVISTIMFTLGTHMVGDVCSRTTPLTTATAILILCICFVDIYCKHLIRARYFRFPTTSTSIYLRYKRLIWLEMYFPALHHPLAAIYHCHLLKNHFILGIHMADHLTMYLPVGNRYNLGFCTVSTGIFIRISATFTYFTI